MATRPIRLFAPLCLHLPVHATIVSPKSVWPPGRTPTAGVASSVEGATRRSHSGDEGRAGTRRRPSLARAHQRLPPIPSNSTHTIAPISPNSTHAIARIPSNSFHPNELPKPSPAGRVRALESPPRARSALPRLGLSPCRRSRRGTCAEITRPEIMSSEIGRCVLSVRLLARDRLAGRRRWTAPRGSARSRRVALVGEREEEESASPDMYMYMYICTCCTCHNVMSCSSGEALELSGRGRGAQRARVRARWCEIRARWCEMHGLACADAQVWWRRGDQRGDLTAGDLSGTLGPMACAAWYMVGARTCPRS